GVLDATENPVAVQLQLPPVGVGDRRERMLVARTCAAQGAVAQRFEYRIGSHNGWDTVRAANSSASFCAGSVLNALTAKSVLTGGAMPPDLRQALARAHIDDRQREAARRQTIRLARRVAEQPHLGDPSIARQRPAPDPPRQSRAPRPTAGHSERPSSLMQTFLRLGLARVRRLQVRIR